MKDIPKLPEAELQIMKILWVNGKPLMAGEISKQLDREWKPSTLLTLIARLANKGFILSKKSETDSRYLCYLPAVREKDYLELEAKSILDKLYDNSIKKFMTALCGEENVNEEELDELEEWLKKRR